MRVAEVDPIGSAEYTYVQAANVIAARIEVGEITHRLPAERDLAKDLGIAYQSLRHAMKLLRDRGLIITRQGRGTFVAPRFARCGGAPATSGLSQSLLDGSAS